MHGVIRLLPRGQVALRVSAIGRRNRKRVVIVDVAQSASDGRVRVRKRESGGAVIKHSGGPGRNRMAGGAGRSRDRKSRRDVIRNVPANRRSALESRRVAAVTVR